MHVRQFDIRPSVHAYSVHLIVAELSSHARRNSCEQRPVWNNGPFGDHGSGSDQRPSAEYNAVHHYRSHPDQALVVNDAAVQDGPMSHRDARTQMDRNAGVGMHHYAVLHICFGAY